MNIKWATRGSVIQGPYCVVQGAIKHISDVGAALSTVTIALYTLKVLCFSESTRPTARVEVAEQDNGQANDANPEDERGNSERERTKSLCLGLGVVCAIWIVLGLLVGINIGADGSYHFYGPTGFWCWIQPHYSVQRTVADYAFMWTTAAIIIVTYAMIVLYLKGYFRTKGWYMYRPQIREPMGLPATGTYGLLFYPLIYTLTILPLSIARYLYFSHHHVPFGATVVVDTIYLATGLFNVLLFSFTRPFLLPRRDLPSPLISLEPYNEPEPELEPEVQDDNTVPPAAPRQHPANYVRPMVYSEGVETFLSSGTGYASGSSRMGLLTSPRRSIDIV
ncbi:hypothetical protein BC827DRAFT_1245247 [Russula dissimulans]|nr:hypothetical protein BC827DRAFT_1245247 [Russula dissimulans]